MEIDTKVYCKNEQIWEFLKEPYQKQVVENWKVYVNTEQATPLTLRACLLLSEAEQNKAEAWRLTPTPINYFPLYVVPNLLINVTGMVMKHFQEEDAFSSYLQKAQEYYNTSESWLEDWEWLPLEFSPPKLPTEITLKMTNMSTFDLEKLCQLHPQMKKLRLWKAIDTDPQWIKKLSKNLEVLEVVDSPGFRTTPQRIAKENKKLKVIGLAQIDIAQSFREKLMQKVLFQPQAIEAVLPSMIKSGRGPSEKTPHGVLLFVGPTGVGKTELAGAIAQTLQRELFVLNMEDYQKEGDCWKLLGCPSGLEGYNNGGALPNFVDKNPNAVILLNEIEKAHKEVFVALLSLLDNGTIKTNKSREINCRNIFLIMTSNLGTKGKGKVEDWKDTKRVQENVGKLWEEIASSESLGRIKGIVPFLPFDQQSIFEILRSKALELHKRVKEKYKYDLSIDHSLIEAAANSVALSLGARPAVEKMKEWVEGHQDIDTFGMGDDVVAWWEENQVRFDLRIKFEEVQFSEAQFYEHQIFEEPPVEDQLIPEDLSQKDSSSSIFNLFSCCTKNVEN